MNKTKIEWCDMTFNPVTGCLHGCKYCYAQRIANRFSGFVEYENPAETRESPCEGLHILNGMQARKRKDGKVVPAAFPFGFEPTLHRYRLDEPSKVEKVQNVFVCSMADLFGPWVPTKWIVDVLDACLAAPQHRYLFLTKYPQRYLELNEVALLPHQDNFWYGSTATNPETDLMAWSDSFHTFVSIEPLLEPFGRPATGAMHDIDWYIIGAETGNRKGKVVPEKAWVDNICEAADLTQAAVFMKDSLIPIVGEENMRRDLPWDGR